jgi:DinB superfamily
MASEDSHPLQPGDVATLLQATANQVQVELSALPEEIVAWHPGPAEWCVKETLGHLIETERRGFAGRIRILLHETEPQLTGWDPEAVARERNDCARPVAEVLAEFSALRADSIALVQGLSDAELDRGGHHPQVGYLRVRDLLHEWVHHDRNHLKQMLANVQAYVWPNMANAQKFAGE